ncbi:MAG: hypothetical protein KA715_07400 [Xanthomonadaceae bacterium]|nr:hypothetical protein [Xanthomonadaceae bacterium]
MKYFSISLLALITSYSISYAQEQAPSPRRFNCFQRLSGVMDMSTYYLLMTENPDKNSSLKSICSFGTSGAWGGEKIGDLPCNLSWNEQGQAVIQANDNELNLVVHTDRTEVIVDSDKRIQSSKGNEFVKIGTEISRSYPGRLTVRWDGKDGSKKFTTYKMGCSDVDLRSVKIGDSLKEDWDQFSFEEEDDGTEEVIDDTKNK